MIINKVNGRYIQSNNNGEYVASSDTASELPLYSAAPDLLEATYSALSLLRGSGFTDNSVTVVKLKAAIKKAEGK